MYHSYRKLLYDKKTNWQHQLQHWLAIWLLLSIIRCIIWLCQCNQWFYRILLPFCMFSHKQHMDNLIQWQFPYLLHIWKHCPSIHHYILSFRNFLSSLLIVIQRNHLILFLRWKNKIPKLLLLRMPSMIHIDLNLLLFKLHP